MPPRPWIVLLAALIGLVGCSPTLNWREVRPGDAGLVAMFPCKPEQFARTVLLAGSRLPMRMGSCSAGGATYALSSVSVDDPVKLSAVMQELRTAAAKNIGASVTPISSWTVPGMTPNPLAARWRLKGHATDATAVNEEAGLFSKGLVVYQATVLGPRLDATAVEAFLSSLTFSK